MLHFIFFYRAVQLLIFNTQIANICTLKLMQYIHCYDKNEVWGYIDAAFFSFKCQIYIAVVALKRFWSGI